MYKILTNGVILAKKFMSEVLHEGACVIDATAGNGNDTVFLAQAVGASGKVYAFDIQAKALENSLHRLRKYKLERRVELIQDSHHNLDRYIQGPIDGIMFNLGYLPGGDKKLITTGWTTCRAMEKALTLLKPGGLMALVIYYGHPGGIEEQTAVEAFLLSLDQNYYSVVRLDFPNRENNPPYVMLVEKRKE